MSNLSEALTNDTPDLIQGSLFHLSLEGTRIGGFNASGQVAMTYTRDISGSYEYIGRQGPRHHFYNSERGIDVYLDRDQFARAYAGLLVRLSIREWA